MQTHNTESKVFQALLCKYKSNELKQMASLIGIDTKNLKKAELMSAILAEWLKEAEQKKMTKTETDHQQKALVSKGAINACYAPMSGAKSDRKMNQISDIKEKRKTNQASECKPSLIDQLLQNQTQTHTRGTNPKQTQTHTRGGNPKQTHTRGANPKQTPRHRF